MADYNVELNRRITAAFPALGVYRVPPRQPSPYQADYNEVQLPDGYSDSADYGRSTFGTPFWDDISLSTVPVAAGEDIEVFTFPNDPLVSVQLRNKITETEVFGGNSVIEMSPGQEAASISLRGVLWNNDGRYPEDQFTDLLNIFRAGRELAVGSGSRLFGLLNIGRIVVERLSLPAIEGLSDSQPFSISARESQDIILDRNTV